jgi:hypothetical protein
VEPGFFGLHAKPRLHSRVRGKNNEIKHQENYVYVPAGFRHHGVSGGLLRRQDATALFDLSQGPSHLKIDFKAKVVTQAGEESGRKSDIKSMTTDLDGKLIIQGVEDGAPDTRDGAGWTISIMDPEGTMVMATAADGFAVVALGACVPLP